MLSLKVPTPIYIFVNATPTVQTPIYIFVNAPRDDRTRIYTFVNAPQNIQTRIYTFVNEFLTLFLLVPKVLFGYDKESWIPAFAGMTPDRY